MKHFNLKLNLLIIDPQNDFCNKERGTLFVEGAQYDMERLQFLIEKTYTKWDNIQVTLDQHHKMHIANRLPWRNKHGDTPPPFTRITKEDIAKKIWYARDPAHQERFENYINQLYAGNKYVHTIWPDHCLIGSWGSNIHEGLFGALIKYEEQLALVETVSKGSNIWSEHFSPVRAEVPDPGDPLTETNFSFLKSIQDSDRTYLCGEAGSHCAASAGRDILKYGGQDLAKKITLLVDCISPVYGCEKMQEDFIKEMIAAGAETVTTDKLIRMLS